MNRRDLITLFAGAAVVPLFAGSAARAHHGWGWATDEEFELTGTVVSVVLGNPHGELTLAVADDGEWVVEIGQPWRNQNAGLTEELLAADTEVTAHGHRSANPDERLMKAERIVIADKSYDLYPDRAS